MKKILLSILVIAFCAIGLKAQTTVFVKGTTNHAVAGQKVWINFFGWPTGCAIKDSTTTDSAGKFVHAITIPSTCYYGSIGAHIVGCQNQYDTISQFNPFDSLVQNNDTLHYNLQYCDSCKYKKAAFKATTNGSGLATFTNLSSSNFHNYYWRFGDGGSSTLANPTHTYSTYTNFLVSLLAVDTVWGCKDSTARYVHIANCSSFSNSFNTTQIGYTVNLFATLKNWPFQYELIWDYGDSTKDTINSPVSKHIYSATGTYNICLKTRDTVNGCTDSVCQSVTITAQNCSNFVADYSSQINNMTGLFIAKPMTGVHEYIWDFGDTVINTDTTNHISRTYNVAGTYTLCLIMRDTIGHCTDTVCKQFTVGNNCAGHNPNFNYNVFGGTVSFTNFMSRPWGTTATYAWSFGDGTSSTLANPSHTYLSSGVYTVCMVSLLNNGCIDSVCKTVIVPKGTCLGFAANFSWIDTCSSLHLQNTSSSTANYYTWKVNGTTVSHQKNYVYALGAPGTYTVCLLAQDTILNCADTICKTITINSNISGVIYRDSAQVADSGWVYLIKMGIDSATNDTTLTAVDSTLFFGGKYNFWAVPTGSYLIKAALAPGAAYYANRLPTYHVQSAVWNTATPVYAGICTSVDITLLSGSNPGGSGFIGGLVTQGANKTGDPLGQILVLLFTADGQLVAWQYTDANGYYKFENLAYGNYKVVVEILGKRSEEYTVTLDDNHKGDSNGNFDVNIDKVVVRKNSTGIAPISHLPAHLYPNPASNYVVVQFETQEEGTATIQITDISGKTLSQTVTTATQGSNSQQINIENLPAGMYIVQLQAGQNTFVGRLIITK